MHKGFMLMSRDKFPPASVIPETTLLKIPKLLLDDESDVQACAKPVVQTPLMPPVIAPVQSESSQQTQKSPAIQAQKSSQPVLLPFAENAENQYGRYVPNSLIVSHLFRKRNTNETSQFAIPPTGVYEVPVVKPLMSELCEYTLPNGNPVLYGKTEEGIDMVSTRFYELTIQHEEDSPVDYVFYPLSPLKGKRLPSEPAHVKRFRDTSEAKKAIENTAPYIKPGRLRVVNEDIPRRADTPRIPDQNTVMGMSAVNVYQEALKKYKNILTDEAAEIMEVASNTLWRGSTIFEAQLRPEHLHLLGYGYYPMEISDKNPHLCGENSTPQRIGNLGAARRCDNTRMMIAERTGERIIRRYANAEVEIGGAFAMLLDTEVINTIYYWVEIVIKDFRVRFTQKIDAFERDPQFSKASDMAMLVEILCMMIQNIAPLSIQHVNVVNVNAITRFPRSFFSRKKNRVQENKKRAREETVVMPASVTPDLLGDEVTALLHQLMETEAQTNAYVL
ncbi:MAG: hypothetical protein A3E82_09420 [Gammaproteobacteria bacterium RIFCSPHIGHO2_12_FULL_38_11]|nr:MAG: hypothetical protein A3E82_09420 [Gammaproteobacteria bacterium RIFCSPHIGHO2_12_FULL_38_11]